MQVLICPDRIGPLAATRVGAVLAEGWPGAEVRPVGEAGGTFVEAVAAGWRVPLQTAVWHGVPVEWAATAQEAALAVRGTAASPATGPIPYAASSVALGRAAAELLAGRRPRRLLLDLAGLDTHDAGAGLLAGLGATAAGADLDRGAVGLTGLRDVDASRARAALDGVGLVGVVPSAERGSTLLGLRGITSRRGQGAAEDPARLLATDAALQRLTELVAPAAAGAPGAGACGGLGWSVLALGGSLLTGPEVGLAGADAAYELVVTGCTVYDFASRGGGVVAAAAELAADRLAPCVVVAGEVVIGAREMRTMGVEAAYPIRASRLDAPTGGDLTETELAATVTRVSRSWRW